MNLRNLTACSLLPVIVLPASTLQATDVTGAGSKKVQGATAVCADSVTDQDGAGCMQASSTATSGLLFPYPGINNTFTAPAVVAGGENNTASGTYSTVSGGDSNYATALNTTVCGGNSNMACAILATVAGGNYNTASAFGSWIGGGAFNSASGIYATIVGGACSSATATFATAVGGYENTASGKYSFAAGREAKALHNGSFVWGDSYNSAKTSSAADQFNVYASGGVRIFSDSGPSAGVLLAPGASSWTMVSDRDAKENLEEVDGREVLERVSELSISTWNYKEQGDSVRHMGPMAQDFWAAFGLGLGAKTIDSIDPGGVALAAIQGLREEKKDELASLRAEQDVQIAELRADMGTEIAELRRANEQLRADLEALRLGLATVLD